MDWDGVSIHPNVNRIPIWINASHVVGLVTSIHGNSCPALCFCDDMTVLDVLGYPNPELDGVL